MDKLLSTWRGLFVAVLMVVYIYALALTWAYLFQRAELFCKIQNLSDQRQEFCVANREFGSLLGGIVWPVYWAARGALWITRP